MRLKLFVGALLLASLANAQTNPGTYFGPGILRRTASDIGSRGGSEVDLRFYLGTSGFVETGYQGLSVDSKGNLVNPGTLSGVGLVGGVYGVHKWKRSVLGLDYSGDVRHYLGGQSLYDNTNHVLRAAYTIQPNARWTLDLRGGGAETKRPYLTGTAQASDVDPTLIATLTDSRYYSTNIQGSATYNLDARTAITFGSGARYQAISFPTSIRTFGYDGLGGFSRQFTSRTSLGADYYYSNDSARDGSFGSEAHSIQGRYNVLLGQTWNLNIAAGIFRATVDQNVPFLLDPALAAIFGTKTLVLVNHTQKTGPSGELLLTWRKRRSSVTLTGKRSVIGGAGSYTASTNEFGGLTYNFTAARKWASWVGVSGNRATGINSTAVRYDTVGGNVGFSYELFPALRLVGGYDLRHYDVTASSYKRTASTATIGLTFSPGTIPLTFR